MRSIIFFLLLLSFCRISKAQDRTIILKDEKITTVPDGYHISGVIDDRDDKSNIGDIDYGNGNKGKLVLQNGADGIRDYIEKNATQDMGTKPMFLHIKYFQVRAKQVDGQWAITTDATLVFYASGYKLIEYSDKAKAETNDDPEVYTEKHLKKMIENDLRSFNEWWPKNGGAISTSPVVQVNVKIATTAEKPNLIVYSQSRPLQIADFTAPEQATGNEAAVTYSGSTVDMTSKVENGLTVVTVVITPYFDTKQSWFKEAGKTPAVLAHEQAHFDITALKACELANSIKVAKFTTDNYWKLLKQLQQENSDAALAEENTYDSETNHGLITDKQHEWEQKLKDEIKASGCY